MHRPFLWLTPLVAALLASAPAVVRDDPNDLLGRPFLDAFARYGPPRAATAPARWCAGRGARRRVGQDPVHGRDPAPEPAPVRGPR